MSRKFRDVVSIFIAFSVFSLNATAVNAVNLPEQKPHLNQTVNSSSPDGLYAAFIGKDGNVYLRHLESGVEFQLSYDAAHGQYSQLSFSYDGHLLAGQFSDKNTGQLVIFDLEQGTREVIADDLPPGNTKLFDWGPERDNIVYAPGHYDAAQAQFIGDGLVIVNIRTSERQVLMKGEKALLINPIVNPLGNLIACERMSYEGRRDPSRGSPFVIALNGGEVHEGTGQEFPDAANLAWLWRFEFLFDESGKSLKPGSGIVDYLPFAYQISPRDSVYGRINPPNPQSALAYPVVSNRDLFVFTLWELNSYGMMDLIGLCRAWQTGELYSPGLPGYKWSFDYLPDLFPLSFATYSDYQGVNPTRWLLCTDPTGCVVVNCDKWEIAYSLPMAQSGTLHNYGAPPMINSSWRLVYELREKQDYIEYLINPPSDLFAPLLESSPAYDESSAQKVIRSLHANVQTNPDALEEQIQILRRYTLSEKALYTFYPIFATAVQDSLKGVYHAIDGITKMASILKSGQLALASILEEAVAKVFIEQEVRLVQNAVWRLVYGMKRAEMSETELIIADRIESLTVALILFLKSPNEPIKGALDAIDAVEDQVAAQMAYELTWNYVQVTQPVIEYGAQQFETPTFHAEPLEQVRKRVDEAIANEQREAERIHASHELATFPEIEDPGDWTFYLYAEIAQTLWEDTLHLMNSVLEAEYTFYPHQLDDRVNSIAMSAWAPQLGGQSGGGGGGGGGSWRVVQKPTELRLTPYLNTRAAYEKSLALSVQAAQAGDASLGSLILDLDAAYQALEQEISAAWDERMNQRNLALAQADFGDRSALMMITLICASGDATVAEKIDLERLHQATIASLVAYEGVIASERADLGLPVSSEESEEIASKPTATSETEATVSDVATVASAPKEIVSDAATRADQSEKVASVTETEQVDRRSGRVTDNGIFLIMLLLVAVGVAGIAGIVILRRR